MPSYETLTFKDLSDRRKETVRAKIDDLYSQGLEPSDIYKKVRLGYRSVATYCGNLTKKTTTKTKKRGRKTK